MWFTILKIGRPGLSLISGSANIIDLPCNPLMISIVEIECVFHNAESFESSFYNILYILISIEVD